MNLINNDQIKRRSIILLFLSCIFALIIYFITEIIIIIEEFQWVPYLSAGILLFGFFYYFIWVLPENIIKTRINNIEPDSKEYYTAVKDYRTTNAQIVGGLFFLITALLTYTQIQNDKKANDNRLLLEQYQKAIDQLSSENVTSRIGGIYSLEKIMNDNEYYHNRIIEILCSYIKERRYIDKFDSTYVGDSSFGYIEIDDYSKERTYHVLRINDTIPKTYWRVPVGNDIQTIINILGRRLGVENEKGLKIDLSYTNLYKANFSTSNFKNANFNGSILYSTYHWCSDFENAELIGVNLENAVLNKSNFKNIKLNSNSEKEENSSEEIKTFIKELDKAKNVRGIKLGSDIDSVIKKDFQTLYKRINKGK
ncbi:MAG: pentapeptide repeat-containing protein [Candidatus Kapabacteria bacterium]|nr:pentapeptide repeat-containing protein [Candidatus Kapabacteria bacterium]